MMEDGSCESIRSPDFRMCTGVIDPRVERFLWHLEDEPEKDVIAELVSDFDNEELLHVRAKLFTKAKQKKQLDDQNGSGGPCQEGELFNQSAARVDNPWRLINRRVVSLIASDICYIYMYLAGHESEFPTKILRRRKLSPKGGYGRFKQNKPETTPNGRKIESGSMEGHVIDAGQINRKIQNGGSVMVENEGLNGISMEESLLISGNRHGERTKEHAEIPQRVEMENSELLADHEKSEVDNSSQSVVTSDDGAGTFSQANSVYSSDEEGEATGESHINDTDYDSESKCADTCVSTPSVEMNEVSTVEAGDEDTFVGSGENVNYAMFNETVNINNQAGGSVSMTVSSNSEMKDDSIDKREISYNEQMWGVQEDETDWSKICGCDIEDTEDNGPTNSNNFMGGIASSADNTTNEMVVNSIDSDESSYNEHMWEVQESEPGRSNMCIGEKGSYVSGGVSTPKNNNTIVGYTIDAEMREDILCEVVNSVEEAERHVSSTNTTVKTTRAESTNSDIDSHKATDGSDVEERIPISMPDEIEIARKIDTQVEQASVLKEDMGEIDRTNKGADMSAEKIHDVVEKINVYVVENVVQKKGEEQEGIAVYKSCDAYARPIRNERRDDPKPGKEREKPQHFQSSHPDVTTASQESFLREIEEIQGNLALRSATDNPNPTACIFCSAKSKRHTKAIDMATQTVPCVTPDTPIMRSEFEAQVEYFERAITDHERRLRSNDSWRAKSDRKVDKVDATYHEQVSEIGVVQKDMMDDMNNMKEILVTVLDKLESYEKRAMQEARVCANGTMEKHLSIEANEARRDEKPVTTNDKETVSKRNRTEAIGIEIADEATGQTQIVEPVRGDDFPSGNESLCSGSNSMMRKQSGYKNGVTFKDDVAGPGRKAIPVVVSPKQVGVSRSRGAVETPKDATTGFSQRKAMMASTPIPGHNGGEPSWADDSKEESKDIAIYLAGEIGVKEAEDEIGVPTAPRATETNTPDNTRAGPTGVNMQLHQDFGTHVSNMNYNGEFRGYENSGGVYTPTAAGQMYVNQFGQQARGYAPMITQRMFLNNQGGCVSGGQEAVNVRQMGYVENRWRGQQEQAGFYPGQGLSQRFQSNGPTPVFCAPIGQLNQARMPGTYQAGGASRPDMNTEQVRGGTVYSGAFRMPANLTGGAIYGTGMREGRECPPTMTQGRNDGLAEGRDCPPTTTPTISQGRNGGMAEGRECPPTNTEGRECPPTITEGRECPPTNGSSAEGRECPPTMTTRRNGGTAPVNDVNQGRVGPSHHFASSGVPDGQRRGREDQTDMQNGMVTRHTRTDGGGVISQRGVSMVTNEGRINQGINKGSNEVGETSNMSYAEAAGEVPWQEKVRANKRRKREVSGPKTYPPIRSAQALPQREILVKGIATGGYDKKIDMENALRDYCEERGVGALFIRIMAHEFDPNTANARIVVHEDDMHTVMDRDFWPEEVYVREWYNKPKGGNRLNMGNGAQGYGKLV